MEDQNNISKIVEKTSVKKTFLFLLVLLFITVLFLLFQNAFLKRSLQETSERVNSISSKLSETEEELGLCSGDKAKVINEYEEPYSQSAFKIVSPLFEGKSIQIKDLLYRGSKIRQMGINIPADDEFQHSVKVTVLDYIDVPARNVKQFDDYQNATSTLIIDSEDEPSLYTTAKGYKMARSCGELGYSKSITSTHSIYVVISGYQCNGANIETAKQQIRDSTKYLDKVADTITF